MESVMTLVAICGALAIGVVSPGPSFVMVARTAVAHSRGDGVAAALGMGFGGVLFACAALLGLHVVLEAVPTLYAVLKVYGGAWLVYLGWRLWRGAATPIAVEADASHRPAAWRRSFWLGVVTQTSNPKTALVYASVFAVFLPAQFDLAVTLALPVLVFAIEAGWYAIVALLLTVAGPRTAYLRGKLWIDRVAGVVLALLGLRLIGSMRMAGA
jgi:threonine/homoserine/homoserine lactone efflux protein